MNDGGSIILIGSNAAHRAYPNFTLYGAAKAAVIYFAKGFSSDLLDRKIRVNVITPGTTDTPAFEKFIPAEQIEAVKSYDTDHHSRDVDHPLDNGLIFCNYFEELGVQK